MIKAYSPKKPDIILMSDEKPLDDATWEAAGCPRMWKCVELVLHKDTVWEAQVDYGYGLMRLLKDSVIVSTCNDFVSYENCILVNKVSWGTPKYLYFCKD